MQSKPRSFAAALLAGALCVSSTVANAATRPTAAVPSATMSAEATLIMCAAAAATAVMAQAPAPAGCVLPVTDAPPVVQVDTPPPPVAPVVVAEAPGFAFGLPAIIALAALAAGAFLLFANDSDGEGSFSRG